MIDPLLFLEETLFSALLGGLIGIEREFDRRYKKSIPIGVRTMMLITMLGTIITLFNDNSFIILGFIPILILSGISFYTRSKTFKEAGLTTYSGLFITYFIGVLVGLNEFLIAVIITVIITLILSLGKEFHDLVTVINRKELESTIVFAIIALVILPLLPNHVIDPFGIFNPFSFWLTVVLISALSFTSYVLLKVLKKGLSITGLLGGLISSKATIYELASTYKTPNHEIINASILSIASSIASNLIVVLIVTRNLSLFAEMLIPLLIGTSLTILLFVKKDGEGAHELTMNNPFTLSSSLKNALIIFLFTQAVYITDHFINPSFTYVTVILAALASGTAASVSIGTLYGLGTISSTLMINLFLTITLVTICDKFILLKVSGNNQLLKKLVKPLIFWSIITIGYAGMLYLLPLV